MLVQPLFTLNSVQAQGIQNLFDSVMSTIRNSKRIQNSIRYIPIYSQMNHSLAFSPLVQRWNCIFLNIQFCDTIQSFNKRTLAICKTYKLIVETLCFPLPVKVPQQLLNGYVCLCVASCCFRKYIIHGLSSSCALFSKYTNKYH